MREGRPEHMLLAGCSLTHSHSGLAWKQVCAAAWDWDVKVCGASDNPTHDYYSCQSQKLSNSNVSWFSSHFHLNGPLWRKRTNLKELKFQRLLRDVDIKRNQFITIFSEREDDRVGRRKEKMEGGWKRENVRLTVSRTFSSWAEPLLFQDNSSVPFAQNTRPAASSCRI